MIQKFQSKSLLKTYKTWLTVHFSVFAMNKSTLTLKLNCSFFQKFKINIDAKLSFNFIRDANPPFCLLPSDKIYVLSIGQPLNNPRPTTANSALSKYVMMQMHIQSYQKYFKNQETAHLGFFDHFLALFHQWHSSHIDMSISSHNI